MNLAICIWLPVSSAKCHSAPVAFSRACDVPLLSNAMRGWMPPASAICSRYGEPKSSSSSFFCFSFFSFSDGGFAASAAAASAATFARMSAYSAASAWKCLALSAFLFPAAASFFCCSTHSAIAPRPRSIKPAAAYSCALGDPLLTSMTRSGIAPQLISAFWLLFCSAKCHMARAPCSWPSGVPDRMKASNGGIPPSPMIKSCMLKLS